MKAKKLLFAILIVAFTFNSCIDNRGIYFDNGISLSQLLSGYDLWYVDYNRTSGNGDIPFVSRAFTLSFFNGTMYANNNIVDVGRTGNGLGITVGNYRTFDIFLETFHDIDGRNDFEVEQLSQNRIRIYSTSQDVSYLLIGYQRSNFDYDLLFYDNIEYFLQEYIAWERTSISNAGLPNAFDNEHYLQFTPENITTFYSSQDPFGTNIANIIWDFVGSYEVFDVQGFVDLKILTLYYDNGDTEDFELSVINDERISLFHGSSGATYEFTGRGFLQFLKNGDKTQSSVRNSDRKRTKVVRKQKAKRLQK